MNKSPLIAQFDRPAPYINKICIVSTRGGHRMTFSEQVLTHDGGIALFARSSVFMERETLVQLRDLLIMEIGRMENSKEELLN